MRLIGLLARLVKPGPSCAEKLAEADAANLRLQAEVARLEAALRATQDSPRSVYLIHDGTGDMRTVRVEQAQRHVDATLEELAKLRYEESEGILDWDELSEKARAHEMRSVLCVLNRIGGVTLRLTRDSP